MEDYSEELQNVWTALANDAGDGGARIMFIAARSKTGVSALARSFAKLAMNKTAKACWLLDLDFYQNRQFVAFGGDGQKWQGPFDMTFGVRPFWRNVPKRRGLESNEPETIVSYQVGTSRLFVSKFRPEYLYEGQSLQIGPSPEYWQAVKNSIDITIIDAPAIDRSKAGLAIAADMDGIVLVVDGDADPRDAIILRDEIIGHGGHCLGVIVVKGKMRMKRMKLAA